MTSKEDHTPPAPDAPEEKPEAPTPSEPTVFIGIPNRVRHDLLNFCEEGEEKNEEASKLRRQAFGFLMGDWDWKTMRLKPMSFPKTFIGREGETEDDVLTRGAKSNTSRRDWEEETDNIELTADQATELEDLITDFRRERKGKVPGRVGWMMTDVSRLLHRAFED